MAGSGKNPSICIVTPTFRREQLLLRFLRRVKRQRYPHWRLIVVHDGPREATEDLVAQFRARDPRIEYVPTEYWSADIGVTPRLLGARRALEGVPGDYCVFWDDDNLFTVDALREIALRLEAVDYPELLLVGFRYKKQVLPPAGVPIASLIHGHIDSASIVVRPQLAVAAYEDVLRRNVGLPQSCFYTSDFQVFEYIRGLDPMPRIEFATDIVVGLHDGLRWKPYLRSLLGIPPLGLALRWRQIKKSITT